MSVAYSAGSTSLVGPLAAIWVARRHARLIGIEPCLTALLEVTAKNVLDRQSSQFAFEFKLFQTQSPDRADFLNFAQDAPKFGNLGLEVGQVGLSKI
ncbi:MAG: hypothetical protein ACREUZ_16860 [Burkholderiales bacterium]